MGIAHTMINFNVADPNDPGMIDMVGFNTSAPQAMAEFARMPMEV